MSLKITSKIQTIEGIELQGAYGRVAVADQINGTVLQSNVMLFASEEAFLNGANALNQNFETFSSTPYDRATMSKDILDLAHDNLIALLAGQGITAEKDLS